MGRGRYHPRLVQAETWTSEARQAQLRVRRQRQARRRQARRLGLGALGLSESSSPQSHSPMPGSPNTLPSGVEIAGVDVAGLSPAAAVDRLERREASLRNVPLTVEVDDRTYDVRPADLALNVDWRSAVAEAQGKTDGVRPLRGLRRLATWAFGTEVTPTATASRQAFARVLEPMTKDDDAYRDAAIRLAGFRPVVVPEREGFALDQEAARQAIVATLAQLDRTPVQLSAGTTKPEVTAEMLAPVADKVRTAVSRPVRLVSGNGYTLVPKWRLARMLDLPSDGERTLRIGGPARGRVLRPAREEGQQPASERRLHDPRRGPRRRQAVSGRPRRRRAAHREGRVRRRAPHRTPCGADRRRDEGACAHDRRGAEDGHHRARGRLHDDLRR